MMVKVLIERKIKPGKEEEFKRLVRELFKGAIHAEGFISGETMKSINDPTVHITIGTWRSIKHWNDWIDSSQRRRSQDKLDQVLAEPMKITPFHYE